MRVQEEGERNVITLAQYFGAKPHTPEQTTAAEALLAKVNPLLTEYQELHGLGPDVDPDTGTEISGSKGGSGDGGFRLQTATTGRTLSLHKVLPAERPRGAAVDASDQDNDLDRWLDTFEVGNGRNTKLAEYGLHREAPHATPTWCHLQDVSPASGKHTFNP